MYSCDDRKRYLLEDLGWRRDIVPEIMDGHNIADFVDPDIDAKLEALERDEDERAAAFAASVRPHLALSRPGVLHVLLRCKHNSHWTFATEGSI